jgi:hypothetical protein
MIKDSRRRRKRTKSEPSNKGTNSQHSSENLEDIGV